MTAPKTKRDARREAAADRYVALVTGAPKDPNADRALNNAAVAYEEIGRFGSASKTYERIYKEYPDSEFADDALLRSGLNHVRFFEFDDAVQSYLVLAEDTRYKDSEHRLIALKNAADLLDNLQQYPKSSDLFVRYASQTKDPKEAIDATFRAAQVLRKTDNHRAAEAAFAAFIGKYGADPKAFKPVDLAIPMFGYKNHVGIDRAHGLIRTWDASAANAHDGARLPDLISTSNTGSGVWADTAYRSKKNEAFLERGMFKSHIHQRKPHRRAMPERIAKANAKRSAIRSAVEHVFAGQKHRMGLIVRTIGIARARIKIGMANLAYNFQRLAWLDGRSVPA